MLFKIRNFLAYLFLFLLPWQTRLIWRAGELNGGYWEYGTVSVYATEILLWLALTLYVAEKLYNGKISNFSRKAGSRSAGQFSKILFSITIGYGLLVTVLVLRGDVHFYYLFSLAEGVGLYFLIKGVDRQKAAWVFILGMVPQALLGIWQFLAQSSFASKWLGVALHDPSMLGTFVVETASSRWFRAYGGMPHPNILGGYLVAAVLLLFWLSSREQGATNNELRIMNHDFGIKNYGRILGGIIHYSLFIILTSCLFFTFSRSAWLALFIGLLVYWFVYPSSPPLVRGGRVGLSSLLSIILVFLILGIIFREPTLARLQNQNRLEVKSRIERVSGYKEAWQIIRRHPAIGVGLGNYTYTVWKEIDSSRPSYAYQPVHNIFILLLAEIGIIGVLLLFVFLFYTLFKNPIIHNSLFIILVLGFFDHYLLTLYPGIMLLFFIASLIKNPSN